MSISVNVLKMSSALKDCQQVCEAGTLESDGKRAFGLFFSPRNPALLANPPTAEISLLQKCVRGEEQNQTWKGPAKIWPQAWAQRAVAWGREQAEQMVTALPALLHEVPGGALVLSAPQEQEDFESPKPVVCIRAHVGFSGSSRMQIFLWKRDPLEAQQAKFEADRLTDMCELSNWATHVLRAQGCLRYGC